MRWRYSALGLATACWGTAAAATKLGLSAFRPATQLLAELAFATSLLLLPVVAIGHRPRRGSLRTYAMLALLDPALPFSVDTRWPQIVDRGKRDVARVP